MALNVELVPAFNDNYLFILTCEETGTTAVVDPGDASAIKKALGERNLDMILCTHHHADHIGGVKELVNTYSCPVYASGYDVEHGRIPHAQPLDESDTINVGDHTANILFTPGHTLGHICYHFADDKKLFCGDTLFLGGCGKLFEGTPQDMFTSLNKLKNLPQNTRVYCAHEYTQNNMAFALSVEPENTAFKDRMEQVKATRAANTPTIPGTLEQELKANIFLQAPTYQKLAELRQLKDAF